VVSERPAGADDDVRFSEALVVAVLEEYSAPGDRVLDDPFAGYGTTLVVAERMRRRSVGIELANRYFGILYHCLQHRVRYDENLAFPTAQ
jgi:DNA modification methylase